MIDPRDTWLKAGHYLFARYGPEALKIDRLARETGKSRSVFYHHFGDLTDYTDELFKYHINSARSMKKESDNIDQLIPDYIEWIVCHKDHMMFSKQLFIHRQENPQFEDVWKKVSEISEDKTAELWMKMLGLDNAPKYKTDEFYELIRSAAFSRLDYDNITYEFLLSNIEQVNRSFQFLLKDKEENE